MRNPDAIAGAVSAGGAVEPRHAPLGFLAFVGLMAALMALNALATDIMLPALPDIEASFGLLDPNAAQTIITAYLLGFGLGQLAMGVLADRYGRKPVLLSGLGVYVIGACITVVAQDFSVMLAARFLQGLGAAAPRVTAAATIRDCFDGRKLARVMSLTMMIFMAAPVVAPMIGQLTLFVAPWRAIFALLALYGLALLVVCGPALPETLRPEHRRAIRLPVIADALASVFGSRQTMGYALAASAFFGAMFGFINSSQQVVAELMGLGPFFPVVFALTAGAVAISSLINSRLVERYGMRVLSHGAVVAYCVLGLVMTALALGGMLGAWVFLPLITLTMFLVGLVFSNFNALALEPQGHVAGVASSVIGSITVLIGASIGYVIGQAFDGTVVPLAIGFAASGVGTLAVLLVTERGRLFRPGR